VKFTLFLTAAALAACAGSTTTPPENPALHADKLYVADEDSGTISVLDQATSTRIKVIDLSHDGEMLMPHNVQAAPDGKTVWVAALPMEDGHAHAPEQLIVIDPLTDEILWRVELGVELHIAHVVLDAQSRFAYVTANEADRILRVDARTHGVEVFVELGAGRGPHGLRACGGKLYVANMAGHSVAVVDEATRAVTEIPVGGVAVQTACTRDGRYVFASLFDTREVVRIDVATHALVRIALPQGSQGPVQLYPTPDSTRVLVCDQGILLDRPASNRLYEVDVDSAAVVATVVVGQGAHGVVVEDEGRRAFVTNLEDGTVSVVDLERHESVGQIAVGLKPNGISHWHVTGAMP